MPKIPYMDRIVARICDDFKEDALAFLDGLRGRGASPGTAVAYMDALSLFLAFLSGRGVPRVQEVSPEDVEAYRLGLVRRGLSAHTTGRRLMVARMFLGAMESGGRIFSNPAADLVVPHPGRALPDVPPPADMRRLLAAPDTATPLGVRDRAAVETLYSTGVRRGELLGMTVFSPGIADGVLRVTGKGRRERIVPLGRQARLWLGKYVSEARPAILNGRPDVEALWLDSRGRPMSANVLLKLVRGLCAKAGAGRIRPHAIRRACATHMLANGAHPVMIQNLLGHETMGTLGEYLKVTIADLKKTHRKGGPGR